MVHYVIGETFPFFNSKFLYLLICFLAGMMHTHKNWLPLMTLVMLEKSGKC